MVDYLILPVFIMHKKPSGLKDCRQVEANKKTILHISHLNSLLLDLNLQVSDIISTCKIGSFHHQVLKCWYDIKST